MLLSGGLQLSDVGPQGLSPAGQPFFQGLSSAGQPFFQSLSTAGQPFFQSLLFDSLDSLLVQSCDGCLMDSGNAFGFGLQGIDLLLHSIDLGLKSVEPLA